MEDLDNALEKAGENTLVRSGKLDSFCRVSHFCSPGRQGESIILVLRIQVVVDFFKTACGSCRYIQPGFIKLCRASEERHSPVMFLRHNIFDE